MAIEDISGIISNPEEYDIITRLVLSLAIVLLSYILSKIAYYFIQNYVKRITTKTKSTVDDRILEMGEKPLHMGIIIIGLAISLNLLLPDYSNTVILLSKVILILIVTFFVASVAELLAFEFLRKIAGRKEILDEKSIGYITRILKFVVLGIGIMIILGELGIEITPLLASAGILSLAVAFAAQETLANVISGTSIAVSRPFRIGDAVMIQNEYGNVERMTLRHTVIRLWDNRRMIIPNSALNKEIIINYSIVDPTMRCKVEIGISYESDLNKAMEIMKNAAKGHKEFMPEMEPVVQILNFGDSSVNLRLLCKAKDQPTAFSMACDLRKTIKEEFERNGIEIPYPRRVIIEKK